MQVPETVDLVFEKYMPDCHIYTDKNRFMQVITNFINNALKFARGILKYKKGRDGL